MGFKLDQVTLAFPQVTLAFAFIQVTLAFAFIQVTLGLGHIQVTLGFIQVTLGHIDPHAKRVIILNDNKNHSHLDNMPRPCHWPLFFERRPAAFFYISSF